MITYAILLISWLFFYVTSSVRLPSNSSEDLSRGMFLGKYDLDEIGQEEHEDIHS